MPRKSLLLLLPAISLLVWNLAAGVATAQTFTTLLDFPVTPISRPYHVFLTQGVDGQLYGTTAGGGGVAGGGGDLGAVFKITPTGVLTMLHRFCSETNCSDGAVPLAGVILGVDGLLYGTTAGGGIVSSSKCGGSGCGTIFKITSGGTITTIYRFCAKTGCPDGGAPLAALVQGFDGNFYGTTSGEGGLNSTVFRITPSGILTTLHTFCLQAGCPDGNDPQAALVQGPDGTLYGTTAHGGGTSAGTVFKIMTSGKLTTMYHFCSRINCTDGNVPFGGLIMGSGGYLYGTTAFGGTSTNCSGGCGTIFKISSTGTLTTLHSFCTLSDCPGGSIPQVSLARGTDGNFYGTTTEGGEDKSFCTGFDPPGCGTLFRISPSGTLTTLHALDITDGAFAADGLTQDTNGSFYGTAQVGGTGANCVEGCGTAYRVSVGLKPFVETVPAGAAVGSTARILGTNLTGATAVRFNGTSARFSVISRTQIKTTVPTGATTGYVTVTTPNGTLRSNVVFQILP